MHATVGCVAGLQVWSKGGSIDVAGILTTKPVWPRGKSHLSYKRLTKVMQLGPLRGRWAVEGFLPPTMSDWRFDADIEFQARD